MKYNLKKTLYGIAKQYNNLGWMTSQKNPFLSADLKIGQK
jgi:hypothetical protein